MLHAVHVSFIFYVKSAVCVPCHLYVYFWVWRHVFCSSGINVRNWRTCFLGANLNSSVVLNVKKVLIASVLFALTTCLYFYIIPKNLSVQLACHIIVMLEYKVHVSCISFKISQSLYNQVIIYTDLYFKKYLVHLQRTFGLDCSWSPKLSKWIVHILCTWQFHD